MNYTLRILIALFIFPSLPVMGQDCSISQSYVILNDASTDILIEVNGLVNEDLGVNQELCQVRAVFTHDQIANVRMTLISPAGEEVILVGPGTVASNVTPFIDWNVRFGQCGVPSVPDVGIMGVWDNSAAWNSFGNYLGTYHPNQGCLEDFDEGSANGTWVLQIENFGGLDGNLLFFELIFCDATGSTCEDCFLFAGEIELQPFPNVITFCQESSFLGEFAINFTQDPIVSDEQSIKFVVSQDDVILSIEAFPTQFDTLPSGEYQVCGVAYNNEDSLIINNSSTMSEINNLIDSRTICGDVTELCLTLNILPPNLETNIDTSFCLGDTIILRGREIFEDFDTTIVTTLLDPDDNPVCDSLIRISAKVLILDAEIEAPVTEVSCGESAFLNALNSTVNEGNISAYNWSTTDGTLVSNVGPIAECNTAGKYFLTIESQGCTDQDSILITANDTFDLDINIEQVFCFGDTFKVSLVSPVDLDNITVLGPQLVLPENDTFTTETNGRYFVTTQFGTCTRLDSIDLQNDATELTIQVSSTLMDCTNNTSELTVTTDAIMPQFNFDGPSSVVDNFPMFSASAQGNYTVTVTDLNLCSATSDFTVDSNQDLPQIDITDRSADCNILPVLLEFNLLSGNLDSVRWEGPDNFTSAEETPLVSTAGIYTLTVYDSNGCSAQGASELSVTNQTFDLMIQGGVLDCSGNDLSLCFTSQNTPAEIEWSFNGMIEGTMDCLDVDALGDYSLLVTDDFGCTATDVFTVEADQNVPALSLGDQDVNCDAFPYDLEVDIQTGNIDRLEWTAPNGFSSDQNPASISVPGIYTVTVFDSNGCSATASSIVTEVNNVFGVNIMGDTLDCIDRNIELCFQSENVVASNAWSINGNAIGDMNCANVSDPGIYDLIVTDENGCTTEATFEVVDIEVALTAIIENTTSILPCSEDSILLSGLNSTVTSSTEWRWIFNGTPISDAKEINVRAAGDYTLMLLESESMCEDETTITISPSSDEFSDLMFEIIEPICEGDEGQLVLQNWDGIQNLTAFLDGNEIMLMDTFILPSGDHELFIEDENGCIWTTDVFNIPEGTEFWDLDLGDDINVPFGTEVPLDIFINGNFDELTEMSWNNSAGLDCEFCLNPILTATENMTLELNIESVNGCTASDRIEVLIQAGGDIYFPNVFNPNENGENSTYNIYLTDANVRVFDFRIFDRWGNLLLFRNEINFSNNNQIWDGTFKGDRVETGVYVFTARVVLPSGESYVKSGHITLLR